MIQNEKNHLIKLFDPYISKEEAKATTKVIQSKFWASGSGTNNVKKFEDSFLKYTKSKNCIAVNSGTAALHLALSLFNIEKKEVLVPSLTFVTTVNSILYNKGKPIFVDVDSKNLCIDIIDIKKKITKKTGAIIIVDFAGMPANIKEIKKIADKNRIPIIEDAAHSAGAMYNGKRIGSHVDAVCFSFHPVKNLAMPTGGAICINNKDVKKSKKILQSLRWCGIENRQNFQYDIKRLGWNYYMNEISAAVGLVQLKKLDFANKKRRSIAKKYSLKLKMSNKMPYSENCVYHFYWIRVKNREKFMKKMYEKGIETGIHYNPVHKMSLYKSKIKLPITEQVANQIVSIPTHPNLTNSEVDKIIHAVNDLYDC
jgi:dTDP-4-amino-4,6-dideoxygalactose transaminase